MSGAAAWLLRMAEKERDARIAAEEMREQRLAVAARFAARTIANEIDLRWRILEGAAADGELRRFLLALEGAQDPIAHAGVETVKKWLDARHGEHIEAAKAASWLVMDHACIRLARSPAANTIGGNFAFRDYFHGGGRDLDPTEAVGLDPIREVHRSVVFESQATKTRMVAFSVPIWSGDAGAPGRRVLGVLAMTVELGRFSVLQIGLGKEHVAVLADTREDWIDGTPRKGLLLHHPLLADTRSAASVSGDPAQQALRLDAGRVELLEKLRAERMREERGPQGEEGRERSASQQTFRDRSYVDPAGGEYAGPWIAEFEPVFVAGRPERVKDTGWVVIVQERVEEPAAAALR